MGMTTTCLEYFCLYCKLPAFLEKWKPILFMQIEIFTARLLRT